MNQTLEDLLRPFKWVDKQVQRPYAKLVKKAEKRKISKYRLSTLFNLGAYMCFIPGAVNYYLTGSLARGIPNYLGFLANSTESVLTPIKARDDKHIDEEQSKMPTIDVYNKISKAIRLPILTTGVTMVGIGINNLVMAVKGDASQWADAANNLAFGAGMISWASAMYTRDSDPRALQRDPLTQRIYEGVMSLFAPKPIPVKIPVKK